MFSFKAEKTNGESDAEADLTQLLVTLKDMLVSHRTMLAVQAASGDITSASMLLHTNFAIPAIEEALKERKQVEPNITTVN